MVGRWRRQQGTGPGSRTLDPSWPAVRQFIELFPHGATRDDVGVLMGVSREGIRKIELQAIAKFRANAARLGYTEAFVDATFESKGEEDDWAC